jgi:hypothetical protein
MHLAPPKALASAMSVAWPRTKRARTANDAMVLSALAGGIHLVATPEHLSVWWAYGAFFIAAAVGQLAFAVLVALRPSTPVLVAGVAGNVLLLGTYVLSRTNGVPLGPHAGKAETAGLLDVVSAVAEVGVIICALALMPPAVGRRVGTALLLVGGAAWVLRFTQVIL